MFLILIRHGQTTANQLKISQGWMDFDLSFEGKQEILEKREKIFEFISTNFDIKRIYTSDLKRAYKTSNLIFKNKFPTTKTISLREINLGIHSGTNDEQWQKIHPESFSEIKIKKNFYYKIPSGESYKEFDKRVWSFTKKKIAENLQSKKTLIFVSHKDVIRSIIKNLQKIPNENYFEIKPPKNIDLKIFKLFGNSENIKVEKFEEKEF